MENLKHFLYITIILIFSACEKADMSGMIYSDISVNERFEESMLYNSQNPFKEIVVNGDEYSIFTASDIHVGGTNNLDIFLNHTKQQNATSVVLAGDLCSGHDYDFETLYTHIENSNTQNLFTIVGNHDLYFEGWPVFYEKFGSSTYYFTVKTPTAIDLFICLDTGGGTLGSSQFEWFHEILDSKRHDFRRCVIFTHNNLLRLRFTTSTNPQVEELRDLFELFAEYNVDMVVTGHDHVKGSEVFGNTVHIITDALQDGYSDAGYFIFNVKQGEIQYNFFNFNK